MSDLKLFLDPDAAEGRDQGKSNLPVSANDAALNRRDLDMIKRDLIIVRKDYSEIRENMIVLTHQHSRTPSRNFFVLFGAIWLFLLALVVTFQPQLNEAAERVISRIAHR